MKKLLSVLVLSAIGIASVASAAPRSQAWKPQRSLATVEDYQALKPGDTVAQVCEMCDSVSMKEVKSMEEAMAYCKDGAVIECPSCGNKAKVVLRGPRPENNRTAVRFVNNKGNDCMFMAKVDSADEAHKSMNRGSGTPHREH